jgi:Ca2+-binding RTX toxin-like protein
VAIFDGRHSYGLRMLELDFLDLSSASLEEPDVTLAGTYIVQWSQDRFFQDVQDQYDGTFTYSHDTSGNLTASGHVTGYKQYVWSWDTSEYISDGFQVSGLFLDVSRLGGLSTAQMLGRMLAGDDVIKGTVAADDLLGFGGDDDLSGYDGVDSLDGGTGADTMSGGLRSDTYAVDDAGDVIVELGTTGGGRDTVESTIGYQLPDFVENLLLTGTARYGYGNGLANEITGNDGGNLLKGGEGADTVDGGNGSDRVYGNRDADLLTGGEGADTFFYKSVLDSSAGATDRISDFLGGLDKIHLAGIDANVRIDANQKFKFIGSAEFSSVNATGQLRFVYDEAIDTGILSASTDVDADAEFVLHLAGVSTLAASDLVL